MAPTGWKAEWTILNILTVEGRVSIVTFQVSPNWELLISAYLQNGRLSERTLTELPVCSSTRLLNILQGKNLRFSFPGWNAPCSEQIFVRSQRLHGAGECDHKHGGTAQRDHSGKRELSNNNGTHSRQFFFVCTQCLCIVCRNPQYIPLVASLDFVRQTTQLSTLLLQHLLEMESTFFRPKVKWHDLYHFQMGMIS